MERPAFFEIRGLPVQGLLELHSFQVERAFLNELLKVIVSRAALMPLVKSSKHFLKSGIGMYRLVTVLSDSVR
eukprot:1363835-Amphidinium_carterae.1